VKEIPVGRLPPVRRATFKPKTPKGPATRAWRSETTRSLARSPVVGVTHRLADTKRFQVAAAMLVSPKRRSRLNKTAEIPHRV